MVFVSTCRSFWDCGSVALDDISLNLGDCDLTAGFLSSSFSGHCDFESGLCGYTQDKRRDSADWQRRRGSTPTSYTGPRGDHTTGLGEEPSIQITSYCISCCTSIPQTASSLRSPGYYMYIEASPMLPGQSARLLSRPVRGTRGPQCLRFYYHMYGSRTGELRVLADKDGEEELLWQRSGEQSIAWLRAYVGYQSQRQHQARVK
ncbi:hypothetical protein XENOCAPTIV_011764 [Xenoophorus captivus]|uniref:MAM domain-containing protein n=1 Tax=Xenoophorus captivus TaxID=1517983 RepID=A0ABV0QA92_9TELE